MALRSDRSSPGRGERVQEDGRLGASPALSGAASRSQSGAIFTLVPGTIRSATISFPVASAHHTGRTRLRAVVLDEQPRQPVPEANIRRRQLLRRQSGSEVECVAVSGHVAERTLQPEQQQARLALLPPLSGSRQSTLRRKIPDDSSSS